MYLPDGSCERFFNTKIVFALNSAIYTCMVTSSISRRFLLRNRILKKITKIFRCVIKNFFTAGEFSWNQCTNMYNTRPHKKDIRFFFLLETLKNFILNDKVNSQITTIKGFFPEKGQAKPAPFSYAPDFPHEIRT